MRPFTIKPADDNIILKHNRRREALVCGLHTSARKYGGERRLQNVKNYRKLRMTLTFSILVSMASWIKFDFAIIGTGFIIAMSVLVMDIFIYCYSDLSPRYIAFMSAIFSPLFRMIVEYFSGGELAATALNVLPDMAFFITYGIVYPVICRYIIRGSKNIKTFPVIIALSDFLSNIGEVTARSLVNAENLFSLEVILSIFLIALIRTGLVQIILISMETYSNLLVRQEHDAEYRTLMVQASILESELHVMKKNMTEIEAIMKKAYNLYKQMNELDAPKELIEGSLEISRNAHEIKGDYINIVNVLNETFIKIHGNTKILMSDIINIEKSNALNMVRRRKLNADIYVRIRTDFYVEKYFKMMSIVRNLITNAIEASSEKGGRVTVTVTSEAESYVISVKDNGKGIDEKDMENIFYDGFSTKFNVQTGDLQRGFGLPLVKDYVENYFNGKIETESEKNKFTVFRVILPKGEFYEVLHS